ncbi:MAG TPA: HlyD family secretion protein, partial [Cyanobacteria bacterium UBA11049]|nr:HlyD family secretion protein [Cyanobacteria bacterium UBA11049]
MIVQFISKQSTRRLIGLLVTATAITGAIAFYTIYQTPQQRSQPQAMVPPVRLVTALGRLEPEAEVIRISTPLNLNDDRVAKLLVKEGDRVKAGFVVAILDSRDRLQDALQQAKQQVRVTQARLAQVKAGAKTGEIQAQEATIIRLQAELKQGIAAQNANIARWQSEVRNASSEYNRFELLYRDGAISSSNLDGKRLSAETAQAQLKEAIAAQNRIKETLQAEINEARATLNRIAEIRPTDVKAAQAEVDNANAALRQAQTNLEQAYIKAPMAGQILKIHTRIGEKISDSGIADFGQTSQMVAVAEVYQTDISKVQLGQQAGITSQAFSGEIRGKVSQIGLQVNRQ